MATAEKARRAGQPTEIIYHWPQQGQWTVDDLARLPDDGRRYESIRGELHVSPTPNSEHQSIVVELSAMLREYLRQHQLGRVLVAPMDVRLTELSSVVQPDVLVVLNEHLDIIQERIEGVPDLIVEILSPKTARHDRYTKYHLYEVASVQEYWIIDPDAGTADVYARHADALIPFGRFTRGGAIHSKLLADLRLPLDDILGPGK